MAFRAFFALHNSLERFKNRNGLHTNAIYAFNTMFENVMQKEQPTHVLVAFDAGKTTFRTEMYAEYKGGRSKTPGEFKEQMPYIRDLLTGLGYSITNCPIMKQMILSVLWQKKVDKDQFDVVVLSGDRDLTQLASKEVKVDITVKVSAISKAIHQNM